MKRRGGKPVALGIIGTGEIVRMISGALRSCKEIEVRAIAGTRMSAAEELAATFPGADAFSDYQPLLQIEEIEAVYIATPPKLHFEMLLSALEAGKHVICEKPLVVSPDELEAVDVVSSGHPGILVASCSSRFQVCPPVRRARSLIAEGSLGRLSHVRLHHSIEPPAPLSSLPRWKQNAATSGGGLCLDWSLRFGLAAIRVGIRLRSRRGNSPTRQNGIRGRGTGNRIWRDDRMSEWFNHFIGTST